LENFKLVKEKNFINFFKRSICCYYLWFI